MKAKKLSIACAFALFAQNVYSNEVTVALDLQGPVTVYGQQVKQVHLESLDACTIYVDDVAAGIVNFSVGETEISVAPGVRNFKAKCFGAPQTVARLAEPVRQTLFGTYDFEAKSYQKTQEIFLDQSNNVTLTLVLVDNPMVTMDIKSDYIYANTDYQLIMRDGSKKAYTTGEYKDVTDNFDYEQPPVAIERDGAYLGEFVYQTFNFSKNRYIEVDLVLGEPEITTEFEISKSDALYGDGLVIDDEPNYVQTFPVYRVEQGLYEVNIRDLATGELEPVTGTIYLDNFNYGFVSGDQGELYRDVTISIDWTQVDTSGRRFSIALKKVNMEP